MLVSPVVAFTASIVALGVAIVYLNKKFEGFRDVVRTVVNGVATYIEDLVNLFVLGINAIIKGINLLKPGKDIKMLQEISIGRIAEPVAVAPSDPGANGSANAVERDNNISINVYGGDPNQVVAALRSYMRQNGSVPIRVASIG
jgi:hypothetical protein